MTPAGAIRFVCLLAAPRTGSNRVCWLLGSSPEVNLKAELFHPDWVGWLSPADRAALRDRSGGAAHDDASLRAWRAAHPARTLEALGESGGGRRLVFKLFPGHLRRSLAAREVFPRSDVAFVHLTRRPIESYISTCKALAVGRHHSVDTTGLRPRLDADDFLPWAARARGWRDWSRGRLERLGRPWLDLSYETDLVPDDAALMRRLADGLARLGAPLAVPAELKALERQDRTGRFQDRVEDWAGFEAAVRARDPDLLDWALRP